DQAVADVVETSAAIFVRDRRSKETELAHLAQDRAIEILLEIGAGDARLQLLLRISLSRIADEALLVAQLMVEVERIRPVERKDGRLAHVICPSCEEVRRS